MGAWRIRAKGAELTPRPLEAPHRRPEAGPRILEKLAVTVYAAIALFQPVGIPSLLHDFLGDGRSFMSSSRS